MEGVTGLDQGDRERKGTEALGRGVRFRGPEMADRRVTGRLGDRDKWG